ncbi:tetratricopeptide repeat protein [Flavobacterium saccharophilum]|uniref:Tetratricopeptide repeat-containing protein n=1 Tax=Flavobacterium saccharophilum TaxID=29534 RepID=A0A1M7JLV2_9FLAO|nr:tetratricopeptide repeat protein [Flavobacterium saccharophilum]SHM53487.1 Tetratricopeptide repeat-containing protein [Flavobacterium saccharophilum]
MTLKDFHKTSIVNNVLFTIFLLDLKNKIAKTIILSIVFFISPLIHSQKAPKNNEYLKKAEQLKNTDTDSAVYYYTKSLDLYTTKKDTFNIIHTLTKLADLHTHTLDYGKAYDGYWTALLLADQSKDEFSKSTLYQALGWLYSYYQRDKEALKYFNLSLSLKKKLVSEKKIDFDYVRSDYFSLVNFYRVNGNYKTAKKYLDSCNIKSSNNPKKSHNFYIMAEAGYLAATDKKFTYALNNLYLSKNYFEQNDPSYLIIIYSLLGNTYKLKGEYAKSEEYFEKSISLSDKFHSHMNYKLMNHDTLAKIYASTNDYKNAYKHSSKSTELNNRIFGRRSKNNEHLFEINDKYRLQKEKEEKQLREQRLIQLENDEKINFLKLILLSVVIISLIIYGYLLLRNIRRKHLLEKKSLAEKQEIELKKNDEIIELKNKELTSSTLQLIEKEEFIDNLKQNLSSNRDKLDPQAINNILKTIQSSSAGNWKEFEARFTAVNQSFYTNLKEKYPELGQTDLKICALVKLNLSSKDMASLLGISFESVHTSRYRLRKKFNLTRNENLNDFIASLE